MKICDVCKSENNVRTYDVFIDDIELSSKTVIKDIDLCEKHLSILATRIKQLIEKLNDDK